VTDPKVKPNFMDNSGARFERAIRSLYDQIKPDKTTRAIETDAKPAPPAPTPADE